MPIVNRIADFHAEMTAWRRDLHAHPETAFEERRTADFVAGKLDEFGVEVHRGLAGTGVVGTLSTGEGSAIALRADMDALPMRETNDFAHRSAVPGKMHACGHDGHAAMLLGAARYLAETRCFAGTVHFIFQPAEEGMGGGKRMVEEGLFEKFPASRIFGMHNWPGLPLGTFGLKAGPIMAASDNFEITVTGHGGHAAMPHTAVDPVVAAAEMVQALQTVTTRLIDPAEPVVLSVTRLHAGEDFGIIPENAVVGGTARTFSPQVRDAVEAAIRRICEAVGAAHGTGVRVDYRRRYPPTVNDAEACEPAARAAARVVGEGKVTRDIKPSMGAEDFAYMLERVPGCYIWAGVGADWTGLHNPRFDFNDELLPIGASYWATLVESELA